MCVVSPYLEIRTSLVSLNCVLVDQDIGHVVRKRWEGQYILHVGPCAAHIYIKVDKWHCIWDLSWFLHQFILSAFRWAFRYVEELCVRRKGQSYKVAINHVEK